VECEYVMLSGWWVVCWWRGPWRRWCPPSSTTGTRWTSSYRHLIIRRGCSYFYILVCHCQYHISVYTVLVVLRCRLRLICWTTYGSVSNTKTYTSSERRDDSVKRVVPFPFLYMSLFPSTVLLIELYFRLAFGEGQNKITVLRIGTFWTDPWGINRSRLYF